MKKLNRYKYDIAIAIICALILLWVYNYTKDMGSKNEFGLMRTVETNVTDNFLKDLKTKFPELEEAELVVNPPVYYFNYTGEDISLDRATEIFGDTKSFIKGEGKEPLLTYYIDAFKPVNFWYLRNRPRMSIIFDVNNDGEIDYEYTSKFYKEEFVSKPGTIPEDFKDINENAPDGYYMDVEDAYETWSFNEKL